MDRFQTRAVAAGPGGDGKQASAAANTTSSDNWLGFQGYDDDDDDDMAWNHEVTATGLEDDTRPATALSTRLREDAAEEAGKHKERGDAQDQGDHAAKKHKPNNCTLKLRGGGGGGGGGAKPAGKSKPNKSHRQRRLKRSERQLNHHGHNPVQQVHGTKSDTGNRQTCLPDSVKITLKLKYAFDAGNHPTTPSPNSATTRRRRGKLLAERWTASTHLGFL